MLITAAGAAIAAVVALALFVPELRLAGRSETLPRSSSRSAATCAASAAVSAEPRRAGSLAASGFVVARRKATIAAEITGKVVEVLIEEGMTVAGRPGRRPARQRAGREGSRAGAVARQGRGSRDRR